MERGVEETESERERAKEDSDSLKVNEVVLADK